MIFNIVAGIIIYIIGFCTILSARSYFYLKGYMPKERYFFTKDDGNLEYNIYYLPQQSDRDWHWPLAWTWPIGMPIFLIILIFRQKLVWKVLHFIWQRIKYIVLLPSNRLIEKEIARKQLQEYYPPVKQAGPSGYRDVE